jgi:hypothetical protein
MTKAIDSTERPTLMSGKPPPTPKVRIKVRMLHRSRRTEEVRVVRMRQFILRFGERPLSQFGALETNIPLQRPVFVNTITSLVPGS